MPRSPCAVVARRLIGALLAVSIGSAFAAGHVTPPLPAAAQIPSFSLPSGDGTWPSPVGEYALDPSPGVNASRLVLFPNGHYDWFLSAPNGSLDSHGTWAQDAQQGLVSLSTYPLPADVPFTLLGAAPNDPLPLNEGDLHVRVGHFMNSTIEADRPAVGAQVTCEGLLRTIDTVTNTNGWASCSGVGVPLHRLTVRLNGLPNTAVFVNPRVNARAWSIDVDLDAAKNPLIFQHEQFWQQNDDALTWKPVALPTAPTWTYRHP